MKNKLFARAPMLIAIKLKKTEILNLKSSNIKTLLSRGREKMKKLLEEDCNE